MDVSVDTIVLSIFFLLPGYAAQRLTGQFLRSPRRSGSTADTLLTNLGVTSAIIGILGVIAATIAGVIFFAHRDWLRQLELGLLLRSGLDDYAISHPWVAILAVGSFSGASFLLACLWGLYDPFGRIVERRQLSKGISPGDMWTMALEMDRARGGYAHAYVRVKLRGSGDVFMGRLRGVSFPFGENPARDVYLQHVTCIDGGTKIETDYRRLGPLSAVLLSSAEIESMTIIYQRGGASGTR